MAESTSPILSRSPHKFEYTSCITTTTPSPAVITPYHSSFDFISEPRDCDTLAAINQEKHPHRPVALGRDLRRLDLDSDQCRISDKARKLDRTESISLPTTPTEQFSPTFEYKYPLLLSLKTQINDDDNINNDDADDDEDDAKSFNKSATDDTTTAPEQDSLNEEFGSNSKK